MTQKLIWHERFHFTGVDSWGHEVDIDGHRDGSGSKPADLLPISLAACTAYDIVNILHKQRQDLQGLDAEITSVQDPDPPWRFTSISIRFVARGPIDPVKAQKALELSESKYCAVSATLRDAVELTFEIEVLPA